MRLLVSFLILPIMLWAQRSDTVTYRLFTNSTTAGVSTGDISNIGQSQHLFFMQLTDNGGTCGASASAFEFYLEGSHDGLTYVPISHRNVILSVGSTASTFQGFGFANGSWPKLRARYTQQPGNCKLNAWYTGTVPTAAFPQLPKAQSTGYITALVRPNTAGTSVVVSNLLATSRIVVYGVHILNAAGSANDVRLDYNSATSCAAVTTGTVIDATGLQGHQELSLPVSIVPWSMSPEGSSLCLVLSASTQANVIVVYRQE